MHHGPNLKPEGKRLFNGGATGVSGCARDQYFACQLLLWFTCRIWLGPLSSLSGLLDEEVERGQWTKLREFELHQLRLAQRQLIQQGPRFFDCCNVHEKYGAFLILASPPLVDLTCQIQLKRRWHFLRKDRLQLLGRRRGCESACSQNLVVGTIGKGRLGFSVVSAVFSWDVSILELLF